MTNRGRLYAWSLAFLLPIFAVYPALTTPIEEFGLDAAYFHVYRGVLFSAARAEGGWYPRWIPELNSGLGSPLLNYYPPLAYFGLDVLYRLGLPHPLGWRALVAFSLIAASAGAFGLGLAAFKRADIALVCAAVFVYSPYFFFDLFDRAGPQGMATAFFPWALWGLMRLAERPSGAHLALASVAWAAMILMHNSTAVLFLAVAAPFAAFLMVRHGVKAWFSIALTLIVGALLGMFHVLPFVVDQPAVRVGASPMPDWAQPALNPLSLSNVLGWPMVLDAGFDMNTLQEKVGVMQTLGWLLTPALAVWFFRRRQWDQAALALGMALVGALVIWLITDSATPVWVAVPALSVIQFRGRLLLLMGIVAAFGFGAALAALARGRQSREAWAALVILAVSMVLQFPALYPGLLHHYNQFSARPDVAEVRAFMERTKLFGLTSMEQFVPHWRTLPFGDDEFQRSAQTPVANLPEGSRVVSDQRQSRQWRIEIETPMAFQAALYQLYYPGWTASVDGQPQPVQPMPETGYSLVSLPAGRSLLELNYEGTLAERVGALVSALSLAGLALAGVLWRNGQPHLAQEEYLAPRWWAPIGLIALAAFKAVWLDPSTTLFRYASTCESVQGAHVQTDIEFGEAFRLCGYSVSSRVLQAGETLRLTLYWEVRQRFRHPTMFVHLLGQSDDLSTAFKAGAQDRLILGGLPAVEWQPGRLYRDEYQVPTRPDTPAGDYVLEVGATLDDRRIPPVSKLAVDGLTMAGDALVISGVHIR